MAWWTKTWRSAWGPRAYRKKSARATRSARERAEYDDQGWWLDEDGEAVPPSSVTSMSCHIGAHDQCSLGDECDCHCHL